MSIVAVTAVDKPVSYNYGKTSQIVKVYSLCTIVGEIYSLIQVGGRHISVQTCTPVLSNIYIMWIM